MPSEAFHNRRGGRRPMQRSAVSLGLAIREQQGGSQIASAISTIAGGAIIVAAAVYFGMLDTSWLPA